jgi:hypothetical protein
MLALPRLGRKLSIFVNCLGLSCIGSALILQTTVITGILRNGYFRGIEQNLVVLWLEAILTAFGVAYFSYMFVRFLFSNK